MKRLSVMFLVLLLATIFSCGEKDDLLVPPAVINAGDADFSNYVALGNSLTAGVMSNALWKEDSQYSFPVLIAGQVGESFVQPLIDDPGLSDFIEPSTIVGVLRLTALPNTIEPWLTTGDPTSLLENPTAVYDNLGIPGITTYDMLSATAGDETASALAGGGANLLVDLILRGSGNTPVEQAIAQNPSFVTLWIGNNDVLGAVVRGDVIPGALPTPLVAFEALYTGIVAQLAAADIDFVVCNIPSVTSIPYAMTVPPVVFNPATMEPVMPDGVPVPWAGIDDYAHSLVLLSALVDPNTLLASTPASLGGLGVPLADAYWLDPGELTAIGEAVAGFNGVISSLATTYGYEVVDINAVLANIAANGYSSYGEELSADFILGGLFSLDGVHPSARGYGIVANEIISVINSEYDAAIPLVNINNLPAMNLPAAKGGRLTYFDVYRGSRIVESLKKMFPAVTH
ncbi:SGNH/GDSL hydrolase family protein [candidate division KSB1 bacterium]